MTAFAELENALQGNLARVDDGWKTSAEWAEAWDKSRSRTFGIISERMRAGTMEMRTERTRSQTGRIMPTPYYRERKRKR